VPATNAITGSASGTKHKYDGANSQEVASRTFGIIIITVFAVAVFVAIAVFIAAAIVMIMEVRKPEEDLVTRKELMSE
jgi:hypothetical protein